jgi:prevent-host-death family protein
MRTASVSKLKATLSEHLAHVKAGEEVVVTERGRPIAKLVPVGPAESSVPPHLLALARAGLVRLGSGRLPRGFWRLPRPKDRRGAVVRALLDERKTGR